MSCRRCGGFMVSEAPLSFFNDASALLSDYTPPGDCPLRCVACGEVIDSVILANRAAQAAMVEKAMVAA